MLAGVAETTAGSSCRLRCKVVVKKADPDAASAATVDPDAPNVLQAMMLFQERRPVHCAAWSRYKESGGAGRRVGCQDLALGEARCVGLCAGSGAMVH